MKKDRLEPSANYVYVLELTIIFTKKYSMK